MPARSVWIVNHYAVTSDLPGGTRHVDLGRELAKRGWQVTLFASSFQHYDHREAKLAPGETWKLEKVDGVTMVWIRTTPYAGNDARRVRNMVSFMLRAWWVGRRLPRAAREIQAPDVVIGSSVHPLAVVAAWRLARRYRARFVMEVRDLWPETLIDMGELRERSLAARGLHALVDFLYHRADRIITLLPRAGEAIAARGVPAERIAWIPNGVNVDRFDPRPRTRNPGDPFTVMYLGAHGRANALDALLEAAKLVQAEAGAAVRFVLIGDGPEKSHLREEAKRLGLENVEFRPPVPKEAVPRALEGADAAVAVLLDLPLYRYGISLNKLYDYLAAGRPMILAGNPVNSPVAEAQCGLSVPPGDPRALAEAVLELAKAPPERLAEMGRRGRTYAKTYHDWSLLADRFADVLEEVVALREP